jgi:hypothetical protein
MWLRIVSDVPYLVQQYFLVATPVPVLVGNAIPRQKLGNFLSLTRNARKSAGDHLELVITPVVNSVTMERIVVLVSLLVRFAVNIPSVCYAAEKRVLHVPKHVHGLASTKGLAPCPVLLPATDCHATSVAPENFPAVTNAQEFAARIAPKSTATNVP